ncbi:peroxiredoxin family protein [Propioniciclava sinopodophylli]|uniref:peroxiredoxin family protein n=1 Tax=Propioniciclava sinopodophylli TaxID=1837344 RepID=UPI0024937DB5|nr:redoxin domain-containing protein [Propioniciclava sinopodophylli]
MNTSTRRDRLRAEQRALAEQQRRQQRIRRILGLGSLLIVVAAVAAMLATSQNVSKTDAHVAPVFTLATTAGNSVGLAEYRGRNVLLYFNEGAGCDSCLMQMTEIEKQKAAFDAANITVLPIVMNTKAQILPEMARFGVTSPFLLDNGTVSQAYGTLGKGMHAGLPGHSFVLIDTNGVQRWYGEYPSMWLAPAELLKEATSRLAA